MPSAAWFRILLAIYAVALVVVGYFPVPVDRGVSPLVGEFVLFMQRYILPFTYETVEFTANVLWFVPFGLLGVLALGRRWWWLVLLLGAAVSTAIEAGQWLLLPERTPTPVDVVANTVGTAIGVAIAVGWLLIRERRPTHGRPSPR
jgi:glycopeptide antibiotics resistance protein